MFGQDVAGCSHPFLEELKSFLDYKETNKDDDSDYYWMAGNEWHENEMVISNAMQQLRLFQEFADINASQSNLKYAAIISINKQGKQTMGDVFLCKNSKFKRFEIPVQPAKPNLQLAKSDGLQIIWNLLDYGSKILCIIL